MITSPVPAFLLGAASASADGVGLEPAHSEGAAQSSTLYWIALVVIVALVAAINIALLYAIRRYRSNRGVAATTSKGGGRTQLRVGASLGVLAIALFVVSIVFTDRAREASADGDSIQITATGQQWLWRYDYPAPSDAVAHPFSYYRLVIPVDTTVNLHVVSTDVAHSWFVPELAGKADAIPGKVHVLSFRADEEGLYNGESAIFSGQGFAAMRTAVQVVSADEYKTYVSDLSTELQDSQDAVVKEIKARSEMP